MRRWFICMLCLSLLCSAAQAASLKRGTRGEGVLEMQEWLIDLGYLDDKADGVFGKKTEAAVKAYQKSVNKKQTGTLTAAQADELMDHPIHPYTESLLSAVPIPDPKIARQKKRIMLEGSVPSPLNMPSGCPFRTRCRYATAKCAEECPELTDRGNGHRVACWNR